MMEVGAGLGNEEGGVKKSDDQFDFKSASPTYYQRTESGYWSHQTVRYMSQPSTEQ